MAADEPRWRAKGTPVDTSEVASRWPGMNLRRWASGASERCQSDFRLAALILALEAPERPWQWPAWRHANQLMLNAAREATPRPAPNPYEGSDAPKDGACRRSSPPHPVVTRATRRSGLGR